MRKYNFVALVILFFLGSLYFGYEILNEMSDFKHYKTEYAKTLDLSETLFDIKEYFWEKGDTQNTANSQLRKANDALSKAGNFSIFMGLLSLLFFGVVYFLFKRGIFSLSQLGLTIVSISFVFLVLGVFTPMMELYAYLDGIDIQIGEGMDIPFLSSILPDNIGMDGKMFAFYQCKSISDLIVILFTTGNYFVGVAILFFSVLFPLLKLIFSTLFILSKKMRNKKIFVSTVSYIGKFSMADVMVVGIVLAFLAINNMSQAVTIGGSEIFGLYLFVGYCVLSILVFFVIKKLTGTYFEEKKIGYENALVLDPDQPLIEE